MEANDMRALDPREDANLTLEVLLQPLIEVRFLNDFARQPVFLVFLL